MGQQRGGSRKKRRLTVKWQWEGKAHPSPLKLGQIVGRWAAAPKQQQRAQPLSPMLAGQLNNNNPSFGCLAHKASSLASTFAAHISSSPGAWWLRRIISSCWAKEAPAGWGLQTGAGWLSVAGRCREHYGPPLPAVAAEKPSNILSSRHHHHKAQPLLSCAVATAKQLGQPRRRDSGSWRAGEWEAAAAAAAAARVGWPSQGQPSVGRIALASHNILLNGYFPF